MTVADLRDQLQYNRWANHCILDCAAQLDAEQLSRDLSGSFPSIRDTLVHIAWAEWLWLERWQGGSPQETWDPAEFPTLKLLRERLAAVEEAQQRFVQGLEEGAGDERIRYRNLQGEEWGYRLREMILHMVVHSAYHRGQATTMLRQLGMVPPVTDYLVYRDAVAGYHESE
ncbi:MAG: DUF664 domain-containing protein [Gemmatimonadales bacterium]|nr:DUF664 domain-containing protein [Gemmatimonadales bacterium]NIN13058.1 DUF664 domain-containing protein [Gemmatimonadales bacterium]NIN51142.1 DUF664 domain-containing protein [Gemmatimonadales bacterium]NIP08606.1 DUF664 domain-containing protein [Gemmatimonadales bacterium]NIR02294.1 DUF664 domain-containing protein [Gemmatimonadales bacterium]